MQKSIFILSLMASLSLFAENISHADFDKRFEQLLSKHQSYLANDSKSGSPFQSRLQKAFFQDFAFQKQPNFNRFLISLNQTFDSER